MVSVSLVCSVLRFPQSYLTVHYLGLNFWQFTNWIYFLVIIFLILQKLIVGLWLLNLTSEFSHFLKIVICFLMSNLFYLLLSNFLFHAIYFPPMSQNPCLLTLSWWRTTLLSIESVSLCFQHISPLTGRADQSLCSMEKMCWKVSFPVSVHGCVCSSLVA